MSEAVAQRRWRLAVRLMVVAFVWSVGLLVAGLFLGIYKGQTTVAEADGLSVTTRTLVQVHGIGALAIIVVPVLACLVAAGALRERRQGEQRWSGRVAWAAVAASALLALLAITWVGAYLIPVVVLLAISVRLVPPAHRVRFGEGRPANAAPQASVQA